MCSFWKALGGMLTPMLHGLLFIRLDGSGGKWPFFTKGNRKVVLETSHFSACWRKDITNINKIKNKYHNGLLTWSCPNLGWYLSPITTPGITTDYRAKITQTYFGSEPAFRKKKTNIKCFRVTQCPNFHPAHLNTLTIRRGSVYKETKRWSMGYRNILLLVCAGTRMGLQHASYQELPGSKWINQYISFLTKMDAISIPFTSLPFLVATLEVLFFFISQSWDTHLVPSCNWWASKTVQPEFVDQPRLGW